MTVSSSLSCVLWLAMLCGAFQTGLQALASPFAPWITPPPVSGGPPALVVQGSGRRAAGGDTSRYYRPVVFWHGMGDSCCDERGVGALANLVRDALPGAFVYSLRFGADAAADVRASYLGNVNDHVRQACEVLEGIKELAGGFSAVGLSQGGQFLRAYVERCNDPPVHNLITFGAQHAGISDLPSCEDSSSAWCKLAFTVARHGAYLPFVQTSVVQAQYFKDPTDIPAYLRGNVFLPDVNNEDPQRRKPEYKARLVSLNRFVMIRFSEDVTVVPKNSSWFGFVKYEDGMLVPEPLQESDLYKRDWLGLRELDEQGKLVFLEAPGPHMRIGADYFLNEVVKPYLAEPVG